MKDIKKITMIGANGALGKTISGIFASFGNAKVYMIGRTMEKAIQAKKEAVLSVKALSIEDNLIPKTFEDIEECIKDSDLIFESVAEDYKIKENIHRIINKYAQTDSIIATGTSGLSIDELADFYSEELKERIIGMHFFNPPYSLTLCEVIPSIYNNKNREFVDDVKKYLKEVLHRDVVEVKNEPAFLANRIGFYFMHEALKFAEKYKNKGGIDYIDAILGCYTGRNMPPIETINFVGLDVYKAIIENIYNKVSNNEKETFKSVEFIDELIKKGKIGVKVNEGLYKKDTENNASLVYDIETKQYRKINKYQFDFKENAIKYFKIGDYEKGIKEILEDKTEESYICMQFLLKYIFYSLHISKKVSEDIMDCDIAMATGFNWIPPCALIEALGGPNEVANLYEKYFGNDIDKTEILNYTKETKYDYRKFLKARE